MARRSLPARAWALLPLGLTLALYLPAAWGADFISDDRPLIPGHLHPGDILGEWTTPTHEHAAGRVGGYLWRPLTSTVYQLWGELFGRTPLPFRLLNVGVHVLDLGLLIAVARRLGASWRAAALVATAWAVHPLLPDAVCWVSDTYDLMATGFLLAAAWLALGEGRTGLRAAGGALLFLAALLSKESALAWAAALPGALLVLRGWRPALVHAAWLAPTAWLHARWHAAVVGRFRTSALDIVARGGFFEVWSDYARWPLHLPVRAGFTHLVSPETAHWSVLGLAVATVGLAALARRATRPLAAAVGVWLVMLAPGALAAIAFGQQASRYLYLPLTLAVPFLAALRPRLRPWMGPALVAAWSLAWLPVTARRIAAWRDEAALFADELRHEPGNSFAMKAVGRMMVERGMAEAGLEMWRQALADPPPSSFVLDVQQERLDLAQAALRAGRPDIAAEALDAFAAEEARAGRAVDPSVTRLRERVAAALRGRR